MTDWMEEINELERLRRRAAELWEQRATKLWQLLDDIDTLGDSMRPPRNDYFKKVNEIVRKRAEVLTSDGYTLRLPLGGSEGRIAELEAEVRRGRELINRDRTGLAEALNAVRKVLHGFRWLGDRDSWASYPDEERTIETLRDAMASCITQTEELCGQALYASGRRADSSFHDGPPIPDAPEPKPVPMILYCPMCTERHIDQGEFETKVHHTHSCQSCGHTWRPAVVPTVGVMFLPGFKDETAATLSDEEIGTRLWVYAVNIDGPPDSRHAVALGRRARQLVPELGPAAAEHGEIVRTFHELWGKCAERVYDKSLWLKLQRLVRA